jgi:hypothetical protein
MWPVWARRKVHTGFWWGNLREGEIRKTWSRWEDNIKMDLQEIELGVDWIHLVQDRDRW